jgi:cell division protein FtsI/penicillin-binding protein 2
VKSDFQEKYPSDFQPSGKGRGYAIFFLSLILVVFLLLFVRCVYLQYFRFEHYDSLSSELQLKWIPVESQRGVFLDSMGRMLAASSARRTVFAEPRVIEYPDTVAEKLHPILDIPPIQLYKKITESSNPGFVRLKRDVSYETAQAAQQVHYGIGAKTEWERNYPTGRLVSNIVGFTGADNRGLEGLELKYDGTLTSKESLQAYLADAGRRSIRLKGKSDEPADGKAVMLTIDATVQQFARSHLLERYKKYNAESAVAIVADPETGAILAMVSLPDFSPDDINQADFGNFKNRAVTDEFEPGSVMKPLVAAIALDEGVVGKNEAIDCENGRYSGAGFGTISEYNNHAYKNLTVREILINSSNIGMAKLGQRLGRKRLYRGLRLLGFGQETRIELPGEADGLLRVPSKWTGYSVTRIPFGQEISVTAIQLVQAYCILANGGHLVEPHLVKAILNEDGEISKYNSSLPAVGYALKPEIANWVTSVAMADVVKEGTGHRAQLDKWEVFGKTGTANIAKKDGSGYSYRNYIASFIAGAPADDPRIVVFVSIRKPDRSLGMGYTGGVVASPVAANIIKDTLTYLENLDSLK